MNLDVVGAEAQASAMVATGDDAVNGKG